MACHWHCLTNCCQKSSTANDSRLNGKVHGLLAYTDDVIFGSNEEDLKTLWLN